MASVYTANHFAIKAIITLTESGSTSLLMSRIRTGIPIYALSRNVNSLGKMTLYGDVYPIYFDLTAVDSSEVNHESIGLLKNQGLIADGDLILLTKGDHMGVLGGQHPKNYSR